MNKVRTFIVMAVVMLAMVLGLAALAPERPTIWTRPSSSRTGGSTSMTSTPLSTATTPSSS